MSAKNKVIAGEYRGRHVIRMLNHVSLEVAPMEFVPLNHHTIKNYNVVCQDSRISFSSALTRAFICTMFFGKLGVVAALTAKHKGIYVVELELKTGEKCLVEISSGHHKCIVNDMIPKRYGAVQFCSGECI